MGRDIVIGSPGTTTWNGSSTETIVCRKWRKVDAEIIYVKGRWRHKNRSVIPCLHYRKDSAEIWQQLPLVWETLCVYISYRLVLP